MGLKPSLWSTAIITVVTFVVANGTPSRADSGNGSSNEALFWSFSPLQHKAQTHPGIGNTGAVGSAWARSPIDQFILSGLQKKGIRPNTDADKRTLIRRLSFDLIGLPPTPTEVAAFEADNSRDAYEKLVDRLLASPHYGERWGRHWLDLARYADSDGFEPDKDRLTAYPYRDFVIRALNSDMPYDQFVRWQLAGDEVSPVKPDAWIATGFCTAGTHSIFTNANEGTPQEREKMFYDEMDDMLTTTCSAFLGLTVGCARCHDHKYDPIPTRDYYRMLAAFNGTRREERSVSSIDTGVSGNQNKHIEVALGLTDVGNTPAISWLLTRGDPDHKAEQVHFGVLSAIGTLASQDNKHLTESHTTLQRTALAHWITDVTNGAGALTARVIVNRLWQHHFGEGLVRTPGDFGVMGDPPANPELLDWLANELIQDGWRLKSLQKTILLSSVYRQSILFDPKRSAVDPENRLLWRRRPMRLEAEAFRDSILAVSGGLDLTMFGPPVKPALPKEAMAGRNKDDAIKRPDADGPEQWRRSIYLWVKRSLPTPMLDVFDSPNSNAACSKRTLSTVPTQSLAILNDSWIRNQAKLFARRVDGVANGNSASEINEAFLLALGRLPSPREKAEISPYLNRNSGAQGVENLCQMLFTLNEFIYVD